MKIVLIAVAVFLANLANADKDDDDKPINYEIHPFDLEECEKLHLTSLQCENSNKMLNAVDEIVNYMEYRRTTFNDAQLLADTNVKYCEKFDLKPEPCKTIERLEAMVTLVFQKIEVTKKHLKFEESAKDMNECKAQGIPEENCKFQVFMDVFINGIVKSIDKNENDDYETEPISFNFDGCYDPTLKKYLETKECVNVNKVKAYIKDLVTKAFEPERDEKYLQFIRKSKSTCVTKNLTDDECYAEHLLSLFIREIVKNVVAEINKYRDNLVPRPTKCDDEKEQDETEIQCISAEILDNILTRSIAASTKHLEE